MKVASDQRSMSTRTVACRPELVGTSTFAVASGIVFSDPIFTFSDGTFLLGDDKI